MTEASYNGRRRAVALTYRPGNAAPELVAKGYGDLAERIIEAARQEGVFVHDAPALVDLLMTLDIDEAIPVELYRVIAELLVWVREVATSPDEA
ncbi:EscU/YscU/HrcU family type III secretion system export apparatus switch protein [Halomonas sp. YLGW01]|uniref:EscU/YscU/HrcU family type III secretion system export apparatus switch protein n=1 Tax=Halomonas sp. YLGW01 TaxID=2773308 RepID=UPI00177DB45E|nr:EscU/YscU/HrcU family type III secretion system export apparatus switch protein [Halomonas sp. YLGW01]